jgi:hypothetical protein
VSTLRGDIVRPNKRTLLYGSSLGPEQEYLRPSQFCLRAPLSRWRSAAVDRALSDYLFRYRSKKSNTAGNTNGTMPPWSALTS